MHEHPTGPAGTPRCALARPGARMAAVSWPGPQSCRGKEPAVSQAPVAVSQRVMRAPLRAVPRASRRPPWPYRERTGCRIVGANRPCRRQSCRVAALRARVSRPAPCAPSLPSFLATIQYFVLQPKTSQPKPLSHDTNFVS